ncbi:MAG: GntR family transcriptional regulator [Pseudomonadota bacterium]
MTDNELQARRRKTATRVDDAYRRLKSEILGNRMAPGFQATEPEIAAMLAMSRTPVREALIRLEGEGLVTLIPRHGARVLPVAAEDMREIYQILTALEPEDAADVAASRPDEAALGPLAAATEEMQAALDRGDLDAWAGADDRFHRNLLALSPNRRLADFVNTLFDQAHRARLITLRLRAAPNRSTAEHRRILEALAAGDAPKTRKLFRSHRERAADELLSILSVSGLSNL